MAASPKKIKIVQITSYLSDFKSYATRGAEVVFCRERNKYVKIQNFGGVNISVIHI